MLFFYAAPLLFQVDAVKEQVKAKCSVFDLKVYSSEDCGLECAWLQLHSHFDTVTEASFKLRL